MLLRAVYRGVNYHEPLTPGKTTVDVQVFEPTDKPSAVSVTAHAIILQPDGSDLDVGEEYNITNKTQPSAGLLQGGRLVSLSLPDGATDEPGVGRECRGHAGDSDHRSIRGKTKKPSPMPFRPGDSGVRMSYKVPYANNQTKLTFVSPYAADRVGIFVPPTRADFGRGTFAAGQEQGFNVYMLQSVAANTPFTVSLSGTAPRLPQEGAAGGDPSQDPSVNSRADSEAPPPRRPPPRCPPASTA